MQEDIFKKINRIIRFAIIASVFFVIGFSDFVSFLPLVFQNNKIAENFRIKNAQASAYIAVSNYDNAASASAAVTKPAGTVNDDIMFAVVMRNTAAVPTVVPAGWALLGRHVNGVYQQSLYWKLAAGEGANYTWSWAAAAKTAITIVTYRGGFDIANPIDVVSNTEFVATPNTTVRAASMNVSAPNSSLFWFGTLYTTTVRTWTKPSIPTTGWIEDYDGGATTSDFSRTVDNMDWAGFGATGNMDGTVVTGGTTVKHAFAVALKPVIAVNPDALSFVNNMEGALLDGGRSSQQITVTGSSFGAGPSDGIANSVKIGTYVVPNGNVISWNATTIVFTIPAAAAVYGGIGTNGLIIRAGGNDDTTPLDFYIYPNITSLSANNGQIGSSITISGDHFGVAAGSVAINNKIAMVGTWGEGSLTTVKIPGQEGAANITGKIQLTRSDAKISNQYPVNPVNFSIIAPSVSGSSPATATAGQVLTIEFSGLGIDTDTGIAPVLKLIKGQPANCIASAACIVGTSYLKVTDYQAVSAIFDLTGAATGWWSLAIINMDTLSGSYGNELTTGFYVSQAAPTVTQINPGFGPDSGITNIVSVIGTNFQPDAAVKMTKNLEVDIIPFTVFTYDDPTMLSGGAFDLSGKTDGWWNVVVTNVSAGTSGSYGNETDKGFQVKFAKPLAPVNLSQSKTQAGIAIAAGEGIGGQTDIYFRMDMEGGLIGENYFPQVEVKPRGIGFDCLNGSPTPCLVPSGGFFAEHPTGFIYNGITPVQGWVKIIGVDNTSYHWQARVRNSAGTSNWISFGANTDPNDIDVYTDNTAPVICQTECITGTDACSGAAINITDLAATIKWNTSDQMSGGDFPAQTPPAGGTYSRVKVDYKKGTDPWNSTVLSAWENSLHQVSLAGLSPASTYTFRMRSEDYIGNEAVSSECTFLTTSSRPIKTVEFFIAQRTGQNNGEQIIEPFSIRIPEGRSLPDADISIKSAFVEVNGISSNGAQTINVGLLRGSQIIPPVGDSYNIDSSGTITPFTILFDALNPQGAGQENMSNLISGNNDPYDYTLFLRGNGVTVSAFSAKLIVTYSYAQ